MRRALAIAALVATAFGCNDLATPSDLVRPQILAVRADPPAIQAGQRAELTIVLAGPDGFIAPDLTRWAIPEVAGLGVLELDGDGRVFLRAPADLDDVAFTAVEVTVEIADNDDLIALKGIAMGVDFVTANPTIVELRVDDELVDDGGSVQLERGQIVPLDALADPFPGENHEYSWYTTSGEIERFRTAPTELIAPEVAEDGVLILVYRDGLGGVTWRDITISTP